RLWYAVALLAFAASLMSKQMLVTLPFVLLLLDWWPLRRIAGWSPEWSATHAENAAAAAHEEAGSPVAPSRRSRRRRRKARSGTERTSAATGAEALPLRRIVIEKLPFFALTLTACVVAVIA